MNQEEKELVQLKAAITIGTLYTYIYGMLKPIAALGTNNTEENAFQVKFIVYVNKVVSVISIKDGFYELTPAYHFGVPSGIFLWVVFVSFFGLLTSFLTLFHDSKFLDASKSMFVFLAFFEFLFILALTSFRNMSDGSILYFPGILIYLVFIIKILYFGIRLLASLRE